MSASQDNEIDLDLHFLPAWAQQSPSVNRYANYQGGEDRQGRGDDRRDRGGPRPRRDQQRPPRRDQPPGSGRDQNRSEPGGRPQQSRRGDGPRGPRRQERPERAPERAPLPEINVAFKPDDKGVDSLARQIRMTGRAYPLFDIAQMILAKPERHSVTFSVKKGAEGQVKQPLFVCALDDSLWMSEEEAVAHVLRNHFATFYQAERTATEAPKGVYTFVAQCGMSGVILGPPNYHDYQNQLRKLHTERFVRMPFDAFKARVRIVKDEAVVKKWIDDQSWKTEFNCLNVPEPKKLATREEVERHFRETHLANIIKPVETHYLSGAASRTLKCPELMRLLRMTWEDQKRFPLQIATVLSQQFATRGLQFFKVNKTVTHVSVARPQYLDLETTPVSEGIKGIVEFINATPRCTHKQLLEALTSGPAPAPSVQGAPAAAPTEPTPEQTAVISDLHWLVHQGHVIEFANGVLETAKKPLPRPPKPAPAPAAGTAIPADVTAAPPGSTDGAAAVEGACAVKSEAAPTNATPTDSTSVVETAGTEAAPQETIPAHMENLPTPAAS
ncbi:MAG TPA: hypothetical protein VGK40_01260 [Verrucomicrobiae bacterium]|jgi:hypothetical protein